MQVTDNDIIVVLTVGSLSQKQLCKTFVSQMSLTDCKVKIVCDDDFGQRIGSGGAILNALSEYYGERNKLIIINCGGFSKRTVSCSVKGKAFAQILDNNRTVTLFEHILANAFILASRFEKGAIVACSDILFDAREVETDFCESTGFGARCDVATGTQHGVMVSDEENKLVRFLHKADAETLRQLACDENGQVTVDTGLVFLNDDLVTSLIDINGQISDKVKTGGVELNFYSDILPLLSQSIGLNEYLNNDIQNITHLKIKEILYKKLSSFSLCVYEFNNGKFLHFGTNKQLIENTLYLSGKAESFLKINSFVDEDVHVGDSTVLDNACLPNGSKIGSGCLVTDIAFNNSVFVDNNCAVCGFRLLDGGFVTVITDIDENPKSLVGSEELWCVPRFYKAQSFDESLNKFRQHSDEERYSLKFCAENADVSYYALNKQYLTGLIQSIPDAEYLAFRKEIVESFLKKQPLSSDFKAGCEAVNVSMPVRVNFCGTWTDAMPYCVENGGGVINAAVTVNRELPISVKLEKLNKKIVEFCSDNRKATYSFDELISNDFSDFNLHKAVFRTVGINSPSQLDCGLRLSTQVDIIDKGSGLGTSSILLTACFKAFSKMFNLDYCDDEIVEMVFVAEQIMKTGGGWQDQIGGLFPGVKYATSQPGIRQEVAVETIALSKDIENLIENKAVLMPTGQCHFGRFIVNDVADRYLNKADGVSDAYCKMKELNETLLKAFRNDDCSLFLDCINRHMQLLRQLSPAVTNPEIDSIIKKCLQVADAVSICGAGAGGYLLIFLKDDQSIDDFKLFVSKTFPEIESEVLKINIFN